MLYNSISVYQDSIWFGELNSFYHLKKNISNFSSGQRSSELFVSLDVRRCHSLLIFISFSTKWSQTLQG